MSTTWNLTNKNWLLKKRLWIIGEMRLIEYPVWIWNEYDDSDALQKRNKTPQWPRLIQFTDHEEKNICGMKAVHNNASPINTHTFWLPRNLRTDTTMAVAAYFRLFTQQRFLDAFTDLWHHGAELIIFFQWIHMTVQRRY